MASERVVKIKLPKLLGHQQEVTEHPARFKVIAWGRRAGKTVTALSAVIWGHGPVDERGEPLWKGAVFGKNIVWVAPNVAQANEEFWPTLKATLNGTWTEKNEVQKKVWLHGGGSVSIRSGEAPDSMRGVEYDGIVLEEAAKQKRYTWSSVLRPTLMTRRGWAIFISTPNAKAVDPGDDENWFARLWEVDGGREGWARWQQSSHINPLLDKAELDQIIADMSTAEHQEEILAAFKRPDDLSQVKRGWWRRYTVLPQMSKGGIFIDLAHEEKKESDYTVCAVVQTDGIGFYWVDLVREKMLFPQVVQTAKDLRALYNLPVYIEDVTNSKPLVQTLQKEMWGVVAQKLEGRDKLARLASVTAQIEAGNCYLPETAGWVHEFVEEHANFPNAPHDDMVDTTSMALRRLSRGPSQRQRGNVLPFRRRLAEVSA